VFPELIVLRFRTPDRRKIRIRRRIKRVGAILGLTLGALP
jgi:hypothetical protein